MHIKEYRYISLLISGQHSQRATSQPSQPAASQPPAGTWGRARALARAIYPRLAPAWAGWAGGLGWLLVGLLMGCWLGWMGLLEKLHKCPHKTNSC